MVNYKNSKVYKIWSHKGDKIYVGSTTKQYLSQRMDKHRSEYKYWKTKQITYMSSYILFEEYGLENCFIELLEAHECNSRDELHKLEGKYIRELECINRCIAGRTRSERREDNKEKLNEQMKQYYLENKEIISEYQKQYHEVNKDKISEKTKIYHEVNKDKISEKNKEKFNCECGNSYTYPNKSRHLKSIIHCQFIESKTT